MKYTKATPLKEKYSWSVKFAPWESKVVEMDLFFLENRNKWQCTLEDCKGRRVALPDASFQIGRAHV
jgi:hypothetical protein